MANPVFSCPKCKQLLGDIPVNGELVAVCPRCRLKYQVVRGRVSAVDGRLVAVPKAEYSSGRYKQRYEVRLQLPSGRVDVSSFELPEGESVNVAHAGDVVSIVHLLRGSVREQLLSIHNATTGQSLAVSLPGDKATAKAWWLGGAGGVAIFVVAASATGSGLIAAVGAVATFVGLGIGLGHRFMPRAELSAEQEAQLTFAQRLLAEKLELDAARARTTRELESRRELHGRLSALRAKMVDVGLDLYRSRIEALDVALATIDRQAELETRLRAGYERSIQMIEIEIEAGAAADALDAASTSHIAAMMAELHELEAQQAELGRQLAANVEVEGILRGANG